MPSNSPARSFKLLRCQLDELGYFQPLVPDAAPLVEALLHDLLTTTSNLKREKERCSGLQQERNRLEERCNVQEPPRHQTTHNRGTSATTRPPRAALRSRSRPSHPAHRTAAGATEDEKEISRLETRVSDLELLNEHLSSQLEFAQKESVQLKNERLDAIQKGKRNKSTVELSSTTTSCARCRHLHTSEAPPPPKPDLIKRFESRNNQLERELRGVCKRLSEAEQEAEAVRSEIQRLRGSNADSHAEATGSSAYVLKLLSENNNLKAKLSDLEREYRLQQQQRYAHHEGQSFHHEHHDHVSRSCDDLRSQADQREKEHLMMHNDCLKRQVGSLRRSATPEQDPSSRVPLGKGKENRLPTGRGRSSDGLNEKFLRAQTAHVLELEERVEELKKENKELKRRVADLATIRRNQKTKIEELSAQRSMFISDGTSDLNKVTSEHEAARMEELVAYIERQRDAYRAGVQDLIKKLDPERKVVSEEVERSYMSILEDDEDEEINREEEFLLPGPSGMQKKPASTTSTSSSKSLRMKKSSTGSSSTARQALSNGLKLSSDAVKTSLRTLRDIRAESKRVVGEINRLKGVAAKKEAYKAAEYERTRGSSILDASEEVLDASRRAALEEELDRIRTELDTLRGDKTELQARLEKQVESLRIEKSGLERRLQEVELERANEGNANAVDLNVSETVLQPLRLRVRQQEITIADLQTSLARKDGEIKALATAKGRLASEVDAAAAEKEVLREELKRRSDEFLEAKRCLGMTEASMTGLEDERAEAERVMKEQKQEINRLQTALSGLEATSSAMHLRNSAEHSVGSDLRRTNLRLEEDLRTRSREAEEHREQIRDLTAHVQRYVNEVKRIEELLALREKERSELLEQYKSLSEEVGSAESFGRKMQGQVESLEVKLAAKCSELEASEKRLVSLEQELMESHLANETTRAQLAELSTKMDLASAQLQEAKSQSTWMDTDLTNIHQLAVQLNSQKVELQTQIAEQNQEIENLTREVSTLREDVGSLSQEAQRERDRSRFLEGELGRKDGNGSKQDGRMH